MSEGARTVPARKEVALSNVPEPLDRRSFVAAELMASHPPVWQHPNKRVVAAISCPPGARHAGTLGYTRWDGLALPTGLSLHPTAVIERPGFYDYVALGGGAFEWHVNFADPNLFVAYGSPLLAQDELQVAEHPSLGALKEALVAQRAVVRTVDGDRPTPVLITGAERRCCIATEPDRAAGRPGGLYGNRFAAADAEIVRDATTAIEPPSVTNLIAMAAPGYGRGAYTADQIEGILVTAYTAFTCAVAEAATQGTGGPSAIHTGYWGCGAFGGNRVLMAALQVLAARMAGVDTLAFHVGDAAGSELLADALDLVDGADGLGGARSARELVGAITAYGFRWGVSDGT